MQQSLNKTISCWSLRNKILVTIVSLLLLLGLSSVLFTRAILLTVLKTEFQRKGFNLARSLAANSIPDVLTQNTLRLKKIVENEKDLDSSIAYVFIIDSSDRVIAHTFDKGFPVDLASANRFEKSKPYSLQLLSTQLGFVYDIAVGMYNGKILLGQVRLGVLQSSIQKTINAINAVFICITILNLIIGALLAYKISSLITKPISKLSEAAKAIQKGDFSSHIDTSAKDEIGALAYTFNEMASRLNQMVEQMKLLSRLEERQRIALDLHDGCAQDFANIIKRLELCERLFKIEPMKAIEELRILGENTRGALNRTREVIFELKSPEDAKFDLSRKLTSYIEDYKKTTDIVVELDMPDTINDIHPVKARPIFYIIAEALTNVKKHAHAKSVQLSLKSDGNNYLKIDIVDDGKGFDINDTKLFGTSRGGWGIIGMRQRTASLGGTLVIDSFPHKGTRVSVNIGSVSYCV